MKTFNQQIVLRGSNGPAEDAECHAFTRGVCGGIAIGTLVYKWGGGRNIFQGIVPVRGVVGRFAFCEKQVISSGLFDIGEKRTNPKSVQHLDCGLANTLTQMRA